MPSSYIRDVERHPDVVMLDADSYRHCTHHTEPERAPDSDSPRPFHPYRRLADVRITNGTETASLETLISRGLVIPRPGQGSDTDALRQMIIANSLHETFDADTRSYLEHINSAPNPSEVPTTTHYTPNTPTTAMPKLFAEEAPWGAPSTGARTQFPANFPPYLRKVISMITLQKNSLLGRNLKPMVVSLLANTFTTAQLQIMDAVLSLAPRPILKDIANTIAVIVRSCWRANTGDVFNLDDLLLGQCHARLFNWMYNIDDEELQAVTGEMITSMGIWHLLEDHVIFSARPISNQKGRVGISWELCNALYTKRLGSRTLSGVRDFVQTLPVVPVERLDRDAQCSICLEPYYQQAPDEDGISDTAVKLGCGHFFGMDCLERLFAPQVFQDMEVSRCPLCRQKMKIVA